MALPCLVCGGPTAADGWCGSCLATPAPPADAEHVVRHQTVPPPPPAAPRRRGSKSDITFGPLGRTLWTLGILALPVPFLWVSGGYAGWGFAALWWCVITPWSMRDLWRRHRA